MRDVFDEVCVILATAQARYALHAASCLGPLYVNDDVNCLRDCPVRDALRYLADQVFKASKPLHGAIGVDGRKPPRMPGVPCFQQIECRSVAHLADNDPIWTQSQTVAD